MTSGLKPRTGGRQVCYADRTNISLAIVEMERELGFSESEDGVVFSSFFIGCTHEQHTPAVLHSSVLLQPLEKSPPPLIPFFIGCTHEHTAVLQPPRRKLSTVQKTLSHPPLIPFADPRPAAADRHLHAAPRRLPRRALWRQGRPRLRAQTPLLLLVQNPRLPQAVYTGQFTRVARRRCSGGRSGRWRRPSPPRPPSRSS